MGQADRYFAALRPGGLPKALGSQNMETCEVGLSGSNAIAILAVLFAALSALYARWAWSEAKRANEIALSTHRKEIYDAFFELKMHMQQKAEFAEISEVVKFYYHSRNAQLYLPKSLSDNISKYYEACFWIADIHRRTGGRTAESAEKSKSHIDTERDLASKIDESISSLIKRANA